MASHPEFGDTTTATEVAGVFADRVRGRNFVVTGVSPASIGYTTAVAIASQGPATLVLASRTQSKLDAVAADIRRTAPSVAVHCVLLDLASVVSVRAAAAEIGRLVPRVDVLINNAGISTPERWPQAAPDGTVLDAQFLTNHLGVFLLTALLLPSLRAAAAAAASASAGALRSATRVVNVSSQGHRLSPVRFSDYAFRRAVYDVPDGEKPDAALPAFLTTTTPESETGHGYPGFLGYGQSKTANILHATELGRRLRRVDVDVAAFSVHPGTIETNLSRSLDEAGRNAIAKTAPKGVWKTQDQGAATTLVAALDPALGTARIGDDGDGTVGYLSDCQLRDDMVAAHAAGAETARRLWEESEKMLQMQVDI